MSIVKVERLIIMSKVADILTTLEKKKEYAVKKVFLSNSSKSSLKMN